MIQTAHTALAALILTLVFLYALWELAEFVVRVIFGTRGYNMSPRNYATQWPYSGTRKLVGGRWIH